MTDDTTRHYNDGEVLSGVQCRRRWTPEEKVRIVEETYLAGMSVLLVPASTASAAAKSLSGAGR